MQDEQLLEFIKSRRSTRRFTSEDVSDDMLNTIMEAGRWAPSGNNNQPWRFCVVRDAELRGKIAQYTKFGAVIKNAPVLICTMIHTPSMYNDTKDHQAVGACLENMLLMIHGLGLGAVWLGEILKNAKEVRETIGLPEELELMAVVALGHPDGGTSKPTRKEMDELVVGRF
jgi:nitroreductase